MENTEFALENKITGKSGGTSFNYETAPEGISAYGLQGIKNCTREWQGKVKDCYRFIFRSRDNINAFLNVTVTASVGKGAGKKSALWCLLENMTGKTFEEISVEEAFKLMNEQVGHWFNCFVGHSTGKNGKTYANLLSSKAKLHEKDKEWGNCHDFFPKAPNGAGIHETPQPTITGFEQYSDHTLTDEKGVDKEYPYLYVLVGCQKVPQAVALLKAAGALQYDTEGIEWRCKQEVKQLAKYYRPSIEQDEVPTL